MKTEILKILENNSRLSTSDIASMINAKEEDVIIALNELEADKIICGYNTVINWDKISDEKCNAIIEVKVVPQCGTGFDRIAHKIAKFSEVDSIFLMSGGAFDFAIQLKGKSMKDVSMFVFDKLSPLEQIQSTATHFVLKKYKDHGVMLEDEVSDKREQLGI